MKIYHVTTAKKLSIALKRGYLKPPIRAWIDIKEAERFSTQTGRRIILRLRGDAQFKQLEGHKGKAVISKYHYSLSNF